LAALLCSIFSGWPQAKYFATLDLIKAAVLLGLLEAAIDVASSRMRAGFAK
jgi:hypothetical protein